MKGKKSRRKRAKWTRNLKNFCTKKKRPRAGRGDTPRVLASLRFAGRCGHRPLQHTKKPQTAFVGGGIYDAPHFAGCPPRGLPRATRSQRRQAPAPTTTTSTSCNHRGGLKVPVEHSGTNALGVQAALQHMTQKKTAPKGGFHFVPVTLLRRLFRQIPSPSHRGRARCGGANLRI